MTEVFLGLGSNVGDSIATIKGAADCLAESDGVRDLVLSPLYRSAPLGKVDQDWFVNAALRLQTTMEPLDFLDACLQVEQRFKRVRQERWGPRTLDLDVLFFGDAVLDLPGLTLPHPRIAERAFVLVPLLDLGENRVLNGRRLSEWLRLLPEQAVTKIDPQ